MVYICKSQFEWMEIILKFKDNDWDICEALLEGSFNGWPNLMTETYDDEKKLIGIIETEGFGYGIVDDMDSFFLKNNIKVTKTYKHKFV